MACVVQSYFKVLYLLILLSFFLFFFFFFWPRSMQDLSPPPGTEPVPPAVEAWSLNHWTTKEVPYPSFYTGTQKNIWHHGH